MKFLVNFGKEIKRQDMKPVQIGGKDDSSETSELKNKGGRQSKESNPNKSNFRTNIERRPDSKRPNGENEMEEKRRTKAVHQNPILNCHSDRLNFLEIFQRHVDIQIVAQIVRQQFFVVQKAITVSSGGHKRRHRDQVCTIDFRFFIFYNKCPVSPTIENTRYDQGGNIVQMIRETVIVFVASLAIQIVDDSDAARNFVENFSIDLSNIRYNKDPFKRKTVILLENGKTLYKLDNVMLEPALAENCRIPPLFKTARPKIGS
uniref:Uncharacterized protein n=1 Tax=Romanomermis culicivorax TaxID=13658 RepID=A0A915KCT1_ROMCU